MPLHNFFLRFAWPMVVIGGLLALACLASTWYIHHLQSDMTRAIRQDAAGREAAQELQIRLRQLRFHSVMAAADPSPARLAYVEEDRDLVNAALIVARRDCDGEDDLRLLDTIEAGYRKYEATIAADTPIGASRLGNAGVIKWADDHPVQQVLSPCRLLVDAEGKRMAERLERSESQTRWAGTVLLGLGLTGALGGLLMGYATARGVTRQVAQLSVRVKAVHEQLDQEVGAMLVQGPPHLGGLDEQLDRVIGRVKDVCERLQEHERELLRAEQLAAVGHLAAGVAHEIRNPLTGIKFLVEAALRPSHPTPLTNEDLRLVRQEITRIERTVQGLLDFARTPPPDRRQHDLRNVVSEAVAVTRGRAEAKPVMLRVEAPAEPVTASIDHDQFLSLLTNLLFNAIEATPPDGRVTIHIEGEPQRGATVTVTDTGPGIDPTIAGRLFTPFATTKSTGTGLGLTLARRVAREHGGSLTGSNRPEGGACFTLHLPGAEQPHVEAAGHR
jgi:signal transduction histidine kinase